MTTNYHTPIATGAPANASIINTPLGQLDAAIAAIAGGDGNTIIHLLTSQFDKTNDTPEEIPGLSVDVVAGNTYIFRGVFQTTSSLDAGAVIGVYGTSIASFFMCSGVISDDSLTLVDYANAINNTITGYTALQNALFVIEGLIVVTNDGTLYPAFCQNAVNATPSSVKWASFTATKIG